MLSARPLVVVGAGFIAGIVAAGVTELSTLFAGLAVASALLLARWRPPAVLFLLGAALGGLRQEWEERAEPPPIVESIEGVVEGPPALYRSLADPNGETESDGTFIVGAVQVRFFRNPVALLGGERVRVRGKMCPPKPATNPGQFDYAAYLKRQGVTRVMTLQELEVLESPPWTSRVRAWFRSRFDVSVRPEVGAFLSSIVLGRRESMPEDLRRNLQQSGTAHLLAISGQNLVIVLLSLWGIATLAGLRGRTLTFTLLALLGGYVFLTGLQVSVVRSYLMIAAYFGADLAWRRRDVLSAMGIAALVICAADPDQVRDAGFQLSFAAVLGLHFIAPVFHAFTGTGGWAWNRLRTALGVSAAAWLATAPIVLIDFNLLTPAIVPANLVLVPLMTVEFVLGLVHLAASTVGLGALTGTLAEATFDAIRASSAAVNAIPMAHAYAPAPPAGIVAAYYAGLAGWAAFCRATKETWWKPCLAVLLVAPLGLTPLARKPVEAPFLAVLDVGRGSCAYLEWPDGRNVMIDCGSLNARDPGSSIAAPYLWHRGVTRLDTLVLSHPDEDHVNGAMSLIRLMKVRTVVVTRAFESWRWPPGVDVVLAERNGPPYRLGELEVLGPAPWEKTGRKPPPNEGSIVLRAAGVLFPGDIEERGVEELLTLPDVRARVLVLPHHGKFHEQHEELVRRVSPEAVLVSAPDGYFSAKVIDALPLKPRITGWEGALELLLR